MDEETIQGFEHCKERYSALLTPIIQELMESADYLKIIDEKGWLEDDSKDILEVFEENKAEIVEKATDDMVKQIKARQDFQEASKELYSLVSNMKNYYNAQIEAGPGDYPDLLVTELRGTLLASIEAGINIVIQMHAMEQEDGDIMAESDQLMDALSGNSYVEKPEPKEIDPEDMKKLSTAFDQVAQIGMEYPQLREHLADFLRQIEYSWMIEDVSVLRKHRLFDYPEE